MFANPTVLREAAAPVETAILLVALAALDVADPELCEAVPVMEEADDATEAIEERSVQLRGGCNTMTQNVHVMA